jgi:hypothetical protein
VIEEVRADLGFPCLSMTAASLAEKNVRWNEGKAENTKGPSERN